MRKKTVSLGIQFNENRLTFGAFDVVGKKDTIYTHYSGKKKKNLKKGNKISVNHLQHWMTYPA